MDRNAGIPAELIPELELIRNNDSTKTSIVAFTTWVNHYNMTREGSNAYIHQLASALGRNTHVKKIYIDLGGKTVLDMTTLATAINESESIVELDLNDSNPASALGPYIATLLGNLHASSLESVSISILFSEIGAMSKTDAEAIKSFFARAANLKRFLFYSPRFGSKAFILSALQGLAGEDDSTAIMLPLEQFHLTHAENKNDASFASVVSSRLALVVQKTPRLTHFSVCGDNEFSNAAATKEEIRSRRQGLLGLLEKLMTTQSIMLKVLVLRGVGLDETSCYSQAFVRCLPQASHLKRLVLKDNSIGIQGMIALADGMESNESVQSLHFDLAENDKDFLHVYRQLQFYLLRNNLHCRDFLRLDTATAPALCTRFFAKLNKPLYEWLPESDEWLEQTENENVLDSTQARLELQHYLIHERIDLLLHRRSNA